MHSRGLAAVARNEGLGPEDALDAVQEAFQTFLLLPHARSLVEMLPKDAAVLLGTLVRNAARNLRRRHHRAAPHEPLGDESPLAAGDVSVDEAIARAEEHVRLLGCVDRLTETQRRVVRLRMLEELSGIETARQLGLVPGRVAVLLHRAKKALLQCLVS
ncbi:sigma-70 family RNA polymerase sigma factor [Anaeromyxobacter sp. Fw109-5]|uniref:sigma-70 family RNA polymerase sigma factor n=1 Tax=Anaeromyxobacter sp. (strain Fw109-5) TaxID=404589 RepID=UPI00031AFC11|nr:sigma-70 family RNA polymerase sigma factor [Anaeromyxobacter sp. Fw109-5]